MFALGIFLGIYAYILFGLGILHVLYKPLVEVTVPLFGFILFNYYKKALPSFPLKIKFNRFEKIILLLFLILAAVNLLGVISPEISFDALWYHLTLPKIYLQNHSLSHIPGGLLYYSDMPKLIELLYIPAISIAGAIGAKFTHFLFGILTVIALYKLSRLFLSRQWSLLACLVFYSNIVVSWLSTVAYIDLGRTFFEVLSLLGLFSYFKTKKQQWLVESAILLGLAISSKLLAVGSLIIFVVLILVNEGKMSEKALKKVGLFSLTTLFIVLPWLVFSYLNTGNPVYPFLSSMYPSSLNISFTNLIPTFWNSFVTNQDPISPLYILIVPFVFLYVRKFTKEEKMVANFSLISLIVWYVTPQTGGGRFLVAYLPIYSLLSIITLKHIDKKFIKNTFFLVIFLITFITIFYRGAAELKYVPVLVGQEKKEEFLSNHLNFKYGDFYDVDGYFSKNITQQDKVLLYGFHNLYYVNFPYVDSSFVKQGDSFNYIATQNTILPKRFKDWNLVYANEKTGVSLFTVNKYKWIY